VGLPALLLLIVVFFSVWAFWPISYLDTSLGHQWVPAIAEAGFYQDENDGGGPFRWTNGKATIVIPLRDQDRPQSLLVRLDRPQDRWLQIFVNHREVINEKGGDREEAIWWEKTIDLTGFELGKEVTVDIASGTRPEPTDASRGELGVRVRGITLLSQRGHEKMKLAMSSFVNVMLGNQPVTGVQESGFHEAELSKDGRFRWTKSKGTLVIPLDANERPNAILVQLGWPRTRSLRITANDQVLFDEKASDQRPPWYWEKTFDVSGIDFGNKITLEIICNTQPLLGQPNGKVDPRELGVAVRGIKLLGAMGAGTN
jgi:hypothetical protein